MMIYDDVLCGRYVAACCFLRVLWMWIVLQNDGQRKKMNSQQSKLKLNETVHVRSNDLSEGSSEQKDEHVVHR
eukprot:scaffold7370_cov137-Skeletonema_dohrnii-CCMP3373.AAC.4